MDLHPTGFSVMFLHKYAAVNMRKFIVTIGKYAKPLIRQVRINTDKKTILYTLISIVQIHILTEAFIAAEISKIIGSWSILYQIAFAREKLCSFLK